MWEWLLSESRRIALETGHQYSDADDIAAETMELLLHNRDVAEDLYAGHKTPVLQRIVKSVAYEMRAAKVFDSKRDFSRWQKVIRLCDLYGIIPDRENAYLIANLSEGTLSIGNVLGLFARKKPEEVPCGFLRAEDEEDEYDEESY